MSSSFQEIEEYYNQKIAEAKAEAEKKAKAEYESNMKKAKAEYESNMKKAEFIYDIACKDIKGAIRSITMVAGLTFFLQDRIRTMTFDEIMDDMKVPPKDRYLFHFLLML